MQRTLKRYLGFVPRAVAPMGKWEPTMKMEDCLSEVSARAAGAVAIAEALDPGGPGPYLLSAEGHLRGMPRPGCLMAARILKDLGANPGRIRCWPAANRTVNEVRAFHSMRQQLGGGGVLLVTSGYHVPRARHILRRELRGKEPIQVVDFEGPLVREALARLAKPRREVLGRAMEGGRRKGLRQGLMMLSECVAFFTGSITPLERWMADTFRGVVDPSASSMSKPFS